MATRTKARKATRPRKAAERPAKKRANGTRKPRRPARKKPNGGRREAPIPRRKGAAKAAKAHARAAGVMPGDGEGKSSASGRMHRVPRRVKELTAPKPRPAGLTREQRKKAANEESFGFKQIEERLDTTRDKAGIAAERRRAVTDFEDEVKEGGVENAAGYVDYDKQERTSDEEPEVDIEAPAAVEEE